MVDLDPDKVYSAAEVAEYLRCSPRLVYRMAASGKLPSFPLGRLRRFRGKDILRYIDEQTGAASDETAVSPRESSAPAVRSDQLYTVEEVAELLRVDVADVIAYTREGKLPGFRVGMAWRYWGRDLLRLGHEQARTEQATGPETEESVAEEDKPARGEY